MQSDTHFLLQISNIQAKALPDLSTLSKKDQYYSITPTILDH